MTWSTTQRRCCYESGIRRRCSIDALVTIEAGEKKYTAVLKDFPTSGPLYVEVYYEDGEAAVDMELLTERTVRATWTPPTGGN